MKAIPEFTENEIWTVETALRERYGGPREMEQAETELRLNPASTALSVCPTLYWEDQGCHFIVCKTGEKNYRCQFFYRIHQMYGTGIEAFDDLAECVVTLLQVQADHASREGEG
jgi:hypothetical protein